MSIYSDYKVGALSDNEFKSLCAKENVKERFELDNDWEGYADDDDNLKSRSVLRREMIMEGRD